MGSPPPFPPGGGEPGDLVLAYACALDARDWARFRALFTPIIALDYGAIGSLVGDIAADDWTARCRSLEGFDATLHRISNDRTMVSGDQAIVDSYVDAVHFIEDGGEELLAHAVGTYRHECVREGGRWRISGCTFTAAGFPGGRAAFDRAFSIARARHAARTTA